MASEDARTLFRAGLTPPEFFTGLTRESRPIPKPVAFGARALSHANDPFGAGSAVVRAAHRPPGLIFGEQPCGSRDVVRRRSRGSLVLYADGVKPRRVCVETLVARRRAGFHLAAAPHVRGPRKVPAPVVVPVGAHLRAVFNGRNVVTYVHRGGTA